MENQRDDSVRKTQPDITGFGEWRKKPQPRNVGSF